MIGNISKSKGFKGDTGDTGPQGLKGDTGPQGPIGPMATIEFQYDSTSGILKYRTNVLFCQEVG